MSERFTALTEWKSLDSGELEGYAAIFNIPDDENDVITPGAFRKTLNDRRQSGQPLPLLADHDLSTDGVIGSVTHAEEDQHGLRVRAKFSAIAKAQDIRARMVEGHLRGMSFTYQAIRFRAGTLAGKAVRFLDELRLFEATITPFPMHPMALASAKAGPGEGTRVHDLDAQLVELERWARTAELQQALSGMVSDPRSAMYALGTLARAQDDAELASLEAWAAAQPPQPSDAERAAARRRDAWDRRNAYSNGLARTMDALPVCSHPGCMPGRCAYAR